MDTKEAIDKIKDVHGDKYKLEVKRMRIHQKNHRNQPPSLRKTAIGKVITTTTIKPILSV